MARLKVRIKGMIEVNNFPDVNMDKYPFVVVRMDEFCRTIWYYGAYDHMDRAQMAAEEVGGFVVVSLEVVNNDVSV